MNSDTKNFLTSLAALRDSTKYALDFLNKQDFTIAVDIDNDNSNSSKSEDLDCSQAFDVLKTLKRDVRTFTNTNFLSAEEDKENEENEENDDEEFKECQTANLDNLHSQLSMIVDSFNSDIDILDTDNSTTKEPKLDIVLSHQETLKSIEITNINSQIELNATNKEANFKTKNEKKATEKETVETEIKGKKGKEKETEKKNDDESNKNKSAINESNNNNNMDNIPTTESGENSKSPNMNKVDRNKPDLHIIIEDADNPSSEIKKSNAAKNFLLSNTMPQTPEIEKIKNYVTDVDLNKLNNIEIIKLILDSLIQTCNELLQFRSDTLSDVLGAYPKSPLSETIIINNAYNPIPTNDNDSNNSDQNEKLKVSNNNDKNNNEMDNNSNKEKMNNTSNSDNSKIENINDENDNMNISSPSSPLMKIDENDGAANSTKQKSPKELLKELECLIILIHSLYENDPNVNSPTSRKDSNTENGKNSLDIRRSSTRNDSMSSVLTSNTELNSVINAIDSLLKSSPRFNNQCVQITADGKKRFQLMGVMSVIDRMTRTRLNDQRASPKQLDHINRLIELLNKSLSRQYGEQRFSISPDKERKMELGRLQYLVEKSKNSRLSNQDWCSQKVIREKEIEDIFEQTKYKTLENQRFIVKPEKERDMYFNTLLKHVDKLDSYRLSNQDAVIKRAKPINDSLYSINSNESDSEIPPKRKEGPIKRLRRFSKSIKS